MKIIICIIILMLFAVICGGYLGMIDDLEYYDED